MGGVMCRPLIHGSRVPVCCLCEKVGAKPWRALAPDERRLWLVQDGQFFCAKCLISHRIDRLQKDKAEEYSASLTRAVAARHAKAPRSWTPLKKVLSGKAWHKTSSFRAPYVPSMSVAEQIGRAERRMSRRSVDARMPSSLEEPMREGLDDAEEALRACARGVLKREGIGKANGVGPGEAGESACGDGGFGADERAEARLKPCRASETSLGQLSAEDLDAVEVESVELSGGSCSSDLSPR